MEKSFHVFDEALVRNDVFRHLYPRPLCVIPEENPSNKQTLLFLLYALSSFKHANGRFFRLSFCIE